MTFRPEFVFGFSPIPSNQTPLGFGRPEAIFATDQVHEVANVIRQAEDAALRGAWVAGLVCYEAAPAFDAAHTVRGEPALPLAWFASFGGDSPRRFDAPQFDRTIAALKCSVDRIGFQNDFETIHRAIERGDVYQVNHTVRLRGKFSGDALAFFSQLCRAQQSAYSAYLELGHWRILSASPELFFRREGSRITAKPMKGTASRGRWPQEDAAMERWLLQSEKNRAENVMIVDLLRNDLSRVSLPHSVKVPFLFSVERFPTVLQMTSTITAQARPWVRLDDVFAALFPCASITGAPKIKAMEMIAALENEPRGAYCGAIGLIAPGGDAIFSVAIRTLTLDTRTSDVTFGVGSGIVWDSTPSEEYDELLIKARFLEHVPRRFHLLETLRLEEGHYWLLERHVARIAASASYFDYPFDERAFRALLEEESQRRLSGSHRIRVQLSADGDLYLESSPLDPLPAQLVLCRVAATRVDRQDMYLFHKTSHRAIFERALHEAPGVFDALLLNAESEVTEFTRGNLVADISGQRYTPPLHCGLLDGTMRRELLERGQVLERVLHLSDVEAADAIWFVNSVRGELKVNLELPGRTDQAEESS